MLTDGRTDGRKVITIAHPKYSSGELKKKKKSLKKVCENKETDESLSGTCIYRNEVTRDMFTIKGES